MNQHANKQIKKAFAGEIIFSEGLKGAPCMYLIKEGQIEIFIVRDDKRIVLSKLGPGACFGEMALITPELRSASAKALSYCELYMVDHEYLRCNIESSPPLIRHIVKSLISRVKSMVNMVGLQAHGQAVLVSYAQLLELLSGQNQFEYRKDDRAAVTCIPIKRVIDKSRALFGNTEKRSRAILQFMDSLQLIRIEAGRDNANEIYFSAFDIVDRAIKLPETASNGLSDLLRCDVELIETDELAQIVGVDRKLLMSKLAADELSDELFAFRKSSVLRWFESKGRDYFASRAPKKPQDMLGIEDLYGVDQITLFEVVNQFEMHEIATLLRVYGNEAVRGKINNALSKAKQAELRDACANVQDVDALKAEQIKTRLMTLVRQSLTGR